MSNEDDGGGTALRERLEAFIGKPVGSGTGVAVAPDPVNQPMIRHWAAAFEDDNPIYVDPDARLRPVTARSWPRPSCCRPGPWPRR